MQRLPTWLLQERSRLDELVADWHAELLRCVRSDEPADPMAPASMPLSMHVTGHLPRAIPRRLEELPVDDGHELQVLGAFAAWLIIEAGARQ